MRIGIVLSQPPGYSETFFTSKIKGLQANGFKVQLFVQKTNDTFTCCPIIEAPSVHKRTPLQLLKMLWVFLGLLPYIGNVRKFLRLERAQNTSWGDLFKKIYLNAHLLKAQLDWLHFGFATQALGSELVAKAIGAKMAVSFRGFDMNVYPIKYPGCYTKLWLQVDKVHSISNYLYEKALAIGLSAATPHQIIKPAVALDDFPETSKKKNKVVQITTIARLHWIKGLDTAITAMGMLKQNGLKFQYYIIGEGSPKDTERYAYQVHQESLKEDIVLTGKLSHSKTLAVLQNTDIYVQPSLNEGFCNAVLEAQAMGKLVVASNVGGLPENLVDGKTGWLFPVMNAEAMAETIEKVVRLPMEEQQKISECAKQRVASNFMIAQQQRQFVSFYTEKK